MRQQFVYDMRHPSFINKKEMCALSKKEIYSK